jgi:hypothetical protein
MGSSLLLALAVAYGAFCVWLGVRFFNRRERWAERTLAATILVAPILYIASFGPACWWFYDVGRRGERRVSPIYRPIGWLIWNGPDWIADPLKDFAHLGTKRQIIIETGTVNVAL